MISSLHLLNNSSQRKQCSKSQTVIIVLWYSKLIRRLNCITFSEQGETGYPGMPGRTGVKGETGETEYTS